MELYLVRHGDAVEASVDPERPLSERGRHEVETVAHKLAARAVRPVEILHSGKARAQQTAEIIAGVLGLGDRVRERSGLAPNDDPGDVATEVEATQDDLMIVGHLPMLERLAGLLAHRDANRSPVSFPTGGVVCLVRGDRGQWRVAWAEEP